jgi:predicted DNA-binding transcriptional regulator YafY
VARYVQEGRWHHSQKLTKQKDGSLLAEFHLDTTEEIKRWILSFGRCAQVLEPEGFRDEIIQELEGMIEEYGESAASHRRES